MSRTECPDLTRILDSQERFAPDVDIVRERVTVGIHRRRRRRRIGYAATAVAVLVLIGAGLAVIRPPDVRPDDGTAATDGRTLRTDAFRRTIEVGWMPAELTDNQTVAVDDTRELFAVTSVANNGMYADLHLSVQLFTSAWQPPTDRPDWEPTTVNGRPGWLASTSTGTYVDWQMPSGRWATLSLGTGTAGAPGPFTQPRLQTDALRAAASVVEGPGQPVQVGIALTYLPSGMTITGVRGSTRVGGCGSITVSTGSARVVGTRQGRGTDGVELRYPAFAPREQFEVSCDDLALAVNGLPRLGVTDEVVDGRSVYKAAEFSSVVVAGLDGNLAAVVMGPPIVRGGSPTAAAPGIDEVVKIALGVRLTS
jgi:hypothetical protein